MTTYVLHTGQSATISGGSGDDSLYFAGYGAAGEPVATFTGSDTLDAVSATGTDTQAGFAVINLMPGGAMATNSMTVDHATLSLNEMPGSAVTFNGPATLSHRGILVATGYRGISNYTLNSTMTIDGTSVANFSVVNLQGSGTIHLTGADSRLWLSATSTGTTVNLDGGTLELTNGMSFLGTITDSAPQASRIGAEASVDLFNAMSAASETFDRATGMLSLFDAQGTQVAALKFAGTGDLYAVPTSGLETNYIAVTSHPSARALPVTFTS
ncbi:MAG TPA: hypothetical protein VE690_21535 [Rhodopila sp.]|nr:hypothetical protein [Rhodopila sp.]